jgi:peptidoglycan/xylan/chitin deacetylase (PgdA/CDA1 family)
VGEVPLKLDKECAVKFTFRLFILISLWEFLAHCGLKTNSNITRSPTEIALTQERLSSSTTIKGFQPTTPSLQSPTATNSPTITSTPTITVTPSITPSPTLGVAKAPPLPHLEVHFITNGDRSQPLVALTFDVGQTPDNPAGFDEVIFSALTEHDAPATFFLGGDWMRTHITETRRLDDNPLFELGNHSWSHPDMRELDETALTSEILRTQDIMFQITGHQTLLFRLPSGFYNDLVLSVAAWRGLYTIQWDVVTADPVPDNTAENILKLVKERVQNGSIIVMHANGRGWHTGEALPSIIEYLRGEGYCLVTVSQMIGLEPMPPTCEISG